MRTLLIPLVVASALGCSDGLFAPIAPVITPGVARLELDGSAFSAEAAFQGAYIRIETADGGLRADIDVAVLRNGRARPGRHALESVNSEGTRFLLFERLPSIIPPAPAPGAPPLSPDYVFNQVNLRVLEGYMEVRTSRADEVNATLYLRADSGPGTAKRLVRLAFSAIPMPLHDDPLPMPPSPWSRP